MPDTLPDTTKTVLARPASWNQPIQRPKVATLRFTAYSWAKFHYLRDLDDAEVFCFAITDPSDPFLVKDLWVPKQEVTSTTVELDDEDLSIRLEEMGQHAPLSTFTRIWLHTHPGSSAKPSSTDLETQNRVFGNIEWSIMAILAKQGEFYCDLQWWGPNSNNKVRVQIPWQVDWHAPFEGADPDRWSAEYLENVTRKKYTSSKSSKSFWPINEPMGGPLTDKEKRELELLASKDEDGTLENFSQYERLLELQEKQSGDEHDTLGYCGPDISGWTT